MLRTDNAAAAEAQAASLQHDRLQHFRDPHRRAGKAIGGMLGAGGAVVWDTYLLFPREAEWKEGPPSPIQWAHQLSATWADPARFRWRDDLAIWLREAVAAIPPAGPD